MRRFVSIFLIISIVALSFSLNVVQARAWYERIFDPIAEAFNNAADVFRGIVATLVQLTVISTPIFVIAPGDFMADRGAIHDLQCWGYGASLFGGCRDRETIPVIAEGLQGCTAEVTFGDMTIPGTINPVNGYMLYDPMNFQSFNASNLRERLMTMYEGDSSNSNMEIYRFVFPRYKSNPAYEDWRRGIGVLGVESPPQIIETTEQELVSAFYRVPLYIGSGITSFEPFPPKTFPLGSRIVEQINGGTIEGGYKLFADYRERLPVPDMSYATIPFNSVCDDTGRCVFVDSAMPEASYVMYVAKVKGSYFYYQGNFDTNFNPIHAYTLYEDKFMPMRGAASSVIFPQLDSRGNPIADPNINGIWIAKTPDDCPDVTTPDPVNTPLPDPIVIVTPGETQVPPGGSSGGSSSGSGGSGGGLCTAATLTITAPDATTYSIKRDDTVLVPETPFLGAATFVDTNVTPHTTYIYTIEVKNAAGRTASVTKEYVSRCIPQCKFTAKTPIPEFGKSKLSWECGLGGIGTIAEACSVLENISRRIVNDGSGERGTVETGPLRQSTDYLLSCRNLDGTINFPPRVIVEKPYLTEVRPRQ